MNFGSCIRCKKAIAYEKINLCDDCRTYYFKLIREYLETNKTSNNVDISNDLNIPLKVINYFVEEGDLVDTSSKYNETREDKIRKVKELTDALKKDLESKKSTYKNARMQFMNEIKKRH